VFDFEKLEVYQVVKGQNLKVLALISQSTSIDLYLKDQWKRASLSILLNLAEGTGRMSVQDKKHYYMIARGSVFECVAILNLLFEMKFIEESSFQELYAGYEQCSKMLLAMYRSMERQQ
jgi:four helix bundle protein